MTGASDFSECYRDFIECYRQTRQKILDSKTIENIVNTFDITQQCSLILPPELKDIVRYYHLRTYYHDVVMKELLVLPYPFKLKRHQQVKSFPRLFDWMKNAFFLSIILAKFSSHKKPCDRKLCPECSIPQIHANYCFTCHLKRIGVDIIYDYSPMYSYYIKSVNRNLPKDPNDIVGQFEFCARQHRSQMSRPRLKKKF